LAGAVRGANLPASHGQEHPMKDLFSLEGRVALVTGGSRGIGRMIAQGFLVHGAKVYITARKAEACDATARELSHYGTCISLPMDVSTVEAGRALAAEIGKREKSLDILVNNAGAAWAEEFDVFTEKGWDKVVDLNMKTPFFLTQALHGLLKEGAKKHAAKVINIASIDGVSVNPWETYSYSASKAGLIHLTRRMSLRLVKDNIVVSGIAPGPFASEMNKMARDHADEVVGHVPAGRIGTDEDMAGVAIYLASRAGDYVVGQTIAVDGGVTIARG
jgi:NAD(P)-dependent dehydrogenase (short-subunit alcohol dehydrogenase family)